ncbi:MAG: glycosyltransferase [Candidatus Eisenbacteria bacterium]|nr:glycosyltransferase [Candidatus Eisenbacteria bacterium]
MVHAAAALFRKEGSVKIGIVTPVFHPYPGGVSEHVKHEYLELRRLGHDVRVVTARFGTGKSGVEEDVIRVAPTVSVPANGSMCPVAVGSGMTARLEEVFDRERFDVLHVHEPLMPFLCLSAVDAARVPVVGTFHASNESSMGYRLFRPALARRVDKLASRICVSQAAIDSVRPYFGGGYEIVPNGVDVERFARAEPLEELRDGSFNILFVGRMEPRKGAKYLFRAMPEILKRVPSARLIVVGGGPLSTYYRSFVPVSSRGRVRFEGRVSNETLARHFTTADVYCSPATGGESFGIVLLEAMAAGAAIVASAIRGYRDVVAHGRTGLLVEPRSPEAIALAIARLHADPVLRERVVEGGRVAVRRYAWPRVTREIESVLLKATGRDRAPADGSASTPASTAGFEREEIGTTV